MRRASQRRPADAWLFLSHRGQTAGARLGLKLAAPVKLECDGPLRIGVWNTGRIETAFTDVIALAASDILLSRGETLLQRLPEKTFDASAVVLEFRLVLDVL